MWKLSIKTTFIAIIATTLENQSMIKITGNNKLLCVCRTIKNAFEFLDVVKPKAEIIVFTMDKNNER